MPLNNFIFTLLYHVFHKNQQKQCEIHRAVVIYKPKCVLCQKFFFKNCLKTQYLCEFKRLFCFYNTGLNSSDNASCFHLSFSFSRRDTAPAVSADTRGRVSLQLFYKLRCKYRKQTEIIPPKRKTPLRFLITIPPDVIILHQGAFCLLSSFTGSVH